MRAHNSHKFKITEVVILFHTFSGILSYFIKTFQSVQYTKNKIS